MIPSLYNIEQVHQLHTDLSVIYVIDGYEASFTAEDGYLASPHFRHLGLPVTCHGETIIEALVALDEELERRITR